MVGSLGSTMDGGISISTVDSLGIIIERSLGTSIERSLGIEEAVLEHGRMRT